VDQDDDTAVFVVVATLRGYVSRAHGARVGGPSQGAKPRRRRLVRRPTALASDSSQTPYGERLEAEIEEATTLSRRGWIGR
jgi:hypothetical protein